jgi:MerR family transcriptional regulator, light-induced transcriptional regulator
VEDECSLRAERGLLVGAFQKRSHYKAARARWGDLAVGAQHAIVFADFATARIPPDAPAEVPVATGDPLEREWAIAWLGRTAAVALIGRELPGERPEPDNERRFELVWSADPEAVRQVVRRAADLADRSAPEIAGSLREDFETFSQVDVVDHDFVVSLASRMIGYLVHGSPRDRANDRSLPTHVDARASINQRGPSVSATGDRLIPHS